MRRQAENKDELHRRLDALSSSRKRLSRARRSKRAALQNKVKKSVTPTE